MHHLKAYKLTKLIYICSDLLTILNPTIFLILKYINFNRNKIVSFCLVVFLVLLLSDKLRLVYLSVLQQKLFGF